MSFPRQQMWSYLEPLFIHSDEVKKELPLDTKRFEKIDGEVKATLAELWKIQKVRILRGVPSKLQYHSFSLVSTLGDNVTREITATEY